MNKNEQKINTKINTKLTKNEKNVPLYQPAFRLSAIGWYKGS